jgi:hypothetical protein
VGVRPVAPRVHALRDADHAELGEQHAECTRASTEHLDLGQLAAIARLGCAGRITGSGVESDRGDQSHERCGGADDGGRRRRFGSESEFDGIHTTADIMPNVRESVPDRRHRRSYELYVSILPSADHHLTWILHANPSAALLPCA